MKHDDALPALPIGEAEVLWHEPDPVMPERPGKIIDASHAFMDAAPLGTRLYSAEQMRAYVRADRAAHAEPVARVGRDGYSVTLEPAAGTLDAVRRLDALPDGALLYAAPPALHEAARMAMLYAIDVLSNAEIALPPVDARDGETVTHEHIDRAIDALRAAIGEQPCA